MDMITTSTLSMLLINTDESYQLKNELLGIKDMKIPVIIVKKSDGLKISELLRSVEQPKKAIFSSQLLTDGATWDYIESPSTQTDQRKLDCTEAGTKLVRAVRPSPGKLFL